MSARKYALLREKFGVYGGDFHLPAEKISIAVGEATPERFAFLKKEAEEAEAQHELDARIWLADAIRGSVRSSSVGFFVTPTHNLEQHRISEKSLKFAILRERADDFSLKSEDLKQTVEVIEKAVFSDKVKADIAKGFGRPVAICYEDGNLSRSEIVRPDEYEKTVAPLAREEIDLLTETIKFYDQVTQIYKDELAKRLEDAKKNGMKIRKEALKRAGNLREQAEKLKKCILKLQEEKLSSNPNLEILKKLNALKAEFHGLENQYGGISSETLMMAEKPMELPPFPQLEQN